MKVMTSDAEAARMVLDDCVRRALPWLVSKVHEAVIRLGPKGVDVSVQATQNAPA